MSVNSQRNPVDFANTLTDEAFERRYICQPGEREVWTWSPTGGVGESVRIDFKSGPSLWPRQLDALLYYRSLDHGALPPQEQGGPFNAEAIKNEFRSRRSRFLLVHSSPLTQPGVLDGYLQFELYHYNGRSVLDIIGLFLADSVRLIGLAQHLLRLVETVASRVPVERVIRSHARRSLGAIRLFNRMGLDIQAAQMPRDSRGPSSKADKALSRDDRATLKVRVALADPTRRNQSQFDRNNRPSTKDLKTIADVSIKAGIRKHPPDEMSDSPAAASSKVIEEVLATVRELLETHTDRVLKEGKSLSWGEIEFRGHEL